MDLKFQYLEGERGARTSRIRQINDKNKDSKIDNNRTEYDQKNKKDRE